MLHVSETSISASISINSIEILINKILNEKLDSMILCPRLITVEEAAHFCGVTQQTVYRWIRKGLIKKVIFGKRCLRLSTDDLKKFVDSKTRNNDEIIDEIINNTKKY